MTDMKYDYPEGLTTCDHLAHDIKQGRFPERSSISQFICERGAAEDKVVPETAAKIAALAHRFWSIHPSAIAATNLTREEFYAREMTRLLTSETERLIALNKKLTEDFNTVAWDRSQWQERAEKASLALAAEQAINKDLKIELDEALVAFADQKVISNYSRKQAISALAALRLARPYVARITSRTSGPDVKEQLSIIDTVLGNSHAALADQPKGEEGEE